MARKYGLEHDRTTVIAYDPGGTSGWAIVSVDTKSLAAGTSILGAVEHLAHGEIVGSLTAQCSELIDLIGHWPTAAVVGESFVIRQFNQSEAFLSPIRINAVVDFVIGRKESVPGNYSTSREVFYQSPSTAKTTISDDTLRKFSAYHPRSPHARDAMRHAITFLRRASGSSKSATELRERAWPGRFD